MTDKEKLNSILRLRLFYSTEKELSELIDYKLKGNHFSRFKEFQCDAYFSKFTEKCYELTHGDVCLSWLLCQYEVTSRFFKQYIENTGHEANKRFIPFLLNYLYMGEVIGDGIQHSKDIILCGHYDAYNKNKEMNVSILILLTYGLIPTFKNKTIQDVPDIISDFEKAYAILQNLSLIYQVGSCTKVREMLCMKEMRKLIEEEKTGDKYLNRLLLIYVTSDVLNRIFALKKPEMLWKYTKEIVPMDFNLPRFWRCDDDADNIVWEFFPTNDKVIYLYRNEIDYQAKKIRFTKYQLIFRDMGYKDLCYTVIMQPSYVWHYLLKRELPVDSFTFDYTNLEYEDDNQTLKKIIFTQDSPINEKTMTLKSVKKKDVLDYYTAYIDHEGVAYDFIDEDCQSQYEVFLETLDVAVSETDILFNCADGVYKMDKFDECGQETIAGICVLTHKDNFVYVELNEDGIKRQILCFDSIGQNIRFEELLKKPFFRKISCLEDLF